MHGKKDINSTTGLKLQGFYKLQVISPSGEVVKDYPIQKNLILNGGMNQIAVTNQFLANLHAYGIVGTGSRPNSITSSTTLTDARSTITQSEDNLIYLFESASLPDFTSSIYPTYTGSLQVGDVVQYFPSLSESMVLAVSPGNDTLVARVNQTYSFDADHSQSFTIWKTSQPDLHGEKKRATSYLTAGDACGSRLDTSSILMWRTYDFTAEDAPTDYSEVGVSWTNTKSATSSFARALLPETVSVDTTYQIRMQYYLFVDFTPKTITGITASIGDWPQGGSSTTYGSESIVRLNASYVGSNGVSTGYPVLDPGGSSILFHDLFEVWMSTASWSLQNLMSASQTDNRGATGTTVWTDNGVSFDTYVNNSFQRTKSASFSITNGNSQLIRSMGVGYSSGAYSLRSYFQGQTLGILFDNEQEKYDTQELNLTWKWVWTRVLS